MIELYLNDSLADIEGKETIATDYSIAPLSDISKRNGAKSIGFKLPLTANNKSILENCHVIVNSTRIPYTLLKARLFVNGVDQLIRFAEVQETQDEVSVRLHGSNIDFFSIIKGRKISDLPDDWDHVWNLVNANTYFTTTSGVIYALIDYHSDSPNAYISNTIIDVRYLLPSVHLHSIITKIVTEAGFTVGGTFPNDADYLNIIIPCIDTKRGDRITEFLTSVQGIQSADNLTGVFIEADSIVYDPLGTIAERTITLFGAPFTAWTFEAYFDGTYDLEIKMNWNSLSGDVDAFVVVNSDLNPIAQESNIGGVGTHTFNITVNLVEGDKVAAFFFGTGSVVPAAGSYIKATATALPEDTKFGKYFEVTANLPNFKQSDLIKAVAQKFALLIDVDNVNKIVYFRQFSEIIANIPNAPDWSDKVDYTQKPILAFRSDYARLNNCTYQDDDEVIKPEGTDSIIEIDDDNLDAEDDLFESPFAASVQVERLNNSIAQIKFFEAGEKTFTPEPRILYKTIESFSIFNLTDGFTFNNKVTGAATHFISPSQDFNLGWDNNLLENFYSDIITALQNYKIVTVPLRLTAADINQLDFFTPVWIEIKGQTGAYFYISKIKQFKSTSVESTDVELVKLT